MEENDNLPAYGIISYAAFFMVHPVNAYFYQLKKMDIQPQKEIVRRFPIIGGEACPQVFCTMDLALLATIM